LGECSTVGILRRVAAEPDAEPQVRFRRPTREHAIALARTRFLAGERVEMNQVAAELDIGRTTLYRWVGEREQLIGEILGQLVDEWVALVEPRAKGTGVDRFLDVLRRYLEHAAGSAALTTFTEREPALALRVLLERDGQVAHHSGAAIQRVLSESDPTVQLPEETVRAIALVAISLVWAYIATGQEPDIDGAITLTGTLVEAARGDRRAAGPRPRRR
jgi:AcrR family transcriptional regulator